MGRLQIVEAKRDTMHEVATGLIEKDGVKYSITLARSLEAPEGKFFVVSVKVDGKEIWSCQNRYNGICISTEVGDKVVFCFVSYDKKIECVVPVDYLQGLRVVKGKPVTSFEVSEGIFLKRFVSINLGLTVEFSSAENRFQSYLLLKQKEMEKSKRLRLKKKKRKSGSGAD